MKKTLLLSAGLPLLFFILVFACPLHAVAQTGPAVAAFIDGPTYDQAKNSYKGSFNVSNGDEIAYLVYKVEDAEAGTERIGDTRVNLGGFSSRPYEFSGAALEDGRKYKLMLQGVDQFGNIIEKTGENVSTQGDDRFYLAIKEFTHVLPKKAAFDFTINSVNADRESETLVFRLTLPGGFRALKYDGYIKDDSNQQVATIQEQLYPQGSTVLETPLPETIAQAAEDHKYKATLRLFTQDDQQAEQTYEFSVPAAIPPGLFERIAAALTRTPVIALAIVVVLSIAVTAVILFEKRSHKPAVPDLLRPPVESTLEKVPSVRRAKLHIRVLQSPGGAGIEKTITTFPAIIGRNPDCTFQVKDPNVSRRHLEITFEAGHLFLTDLNSNNGTFINNERLRGQTPRRITSTVCVRLAEQTVIELEPVA